MIEEVAGLSGETKALLVGIARQLEPHREEIATRWTRSYFDSHPEATAQNLSQITQRTRAELGRFFQYIKRGSFEEYFQTTEAIGRSLARSGVSYDELMSYIHLYEESSLPTLMILYPESDRLQRALIALDSLYHHNIALLASAYFAVKEEVLIQREEELVLRNKELSALQLVTDVALSTLDLDTLLQDLLGRVVHGLDADGGTILLLEESSRELKAKASFGLDREFASNYRAGVGEGLAGRVASGQRAVSVVDGDEGWLLDPFISRTGMKSVLGVPLKGHRRTLGVVHVGRLAQRTFGSYEVNLLHIMAARAAAAIENAQIYERQRDRAKVLEEISLLKSHFVTKVAHVLRTPLTTTSGNLQTLLRHWSRMSDEEKRLHVGKSYEASKRLTRLVDDMLFVMRLQDGRFQVKLTAVSPKQVVEQAVHEIETRYRDHRVEVEVPPDLPNVWADSERLLQVVLNLLDNAVKFSAPPAPVSVKMRTQNHELITEIADQGIGISPEEMPNLFTAFGEGDHRASTRSGPGIGLFIAKQLVEAMGGRIWVESQPERGSSFFFSLLVAPEPAPPKDSRSPSMATDTGSSSQLNVETTAHQWEAM